MDFASCCTETNPLLDICISQYAVGGWNACSVIRSATRTGAGPEVEGQAAQVCLK